MKVKAEAGCAYVAAVHAKAGSDILFGVRSEHFLRCIVQIPTLHQHAQARSDSCEHFQIVLREMRARTSSHRGHRTKGAVGALCGELCDSPRASRSVDQFACVLLDRIHLAVSGTLLSRLRV